MSERSTRVLLIEDNPGDADLIRLRLVEGSSPVDVSCAQRLSDGLASISSPTARERRRSAKFWQRLRTYL